jgi:hypothetical protein
MWSEKPWGPLERRGPAEESVRQRTGCAGRWLQRIRCGAQLGAKRRVYTRADTATPSPKKEKHDESNNA